MIFKVDNGMLAVWGQSNFGDLRTPHVTPIYQLNNHEAYLFCRYYQFHSVANDDELPMKTRQEAQAQSQNTLTELLSASARRGRFPILDRIREIGNVEIAQATDKVRKLERIIERLESAARGNILLCHENRRVPSDINLVHNQTGHPLSHWKSQLRIAESKVTGAQVRFVTALREGTAFKPRDCFKLPSIAPDFLERHRPFISAREFLQAMQSDPDLNGFLFVDTPPKIALVGPAVIAATVHDNGVTSYCLYGKASDAKIQSKWTPPAPESPLLPFGPFPWSSLGLNFDCDRTEGLFAPPKGTIMENPKFLTFVNDRMINAIRIMIKFATEDYTHLGLPVIIDPHFLYGFQELMNGMEDLMEGRDPDGGYIPMEGTLARALIFLLSCLGEREEILTPGGATATKVLAHEERIVRIRNNLNLLFLLARPPTQQAETVAVPEEEPEPYVIDAAQWHLLNQIRKQQAEAMGESEDRKQQAIAGKDPNHHHRGIVLSFFQDLQLATRYRQGNPAPLGITLIGPLAKHMAEFETLVLSPRKQISKKEATKRMDAVVSEIQMELNSDEVALLLDVKHLEVFNPEKLSQQVLLANGKPDHMDEQMIRKYGRKIVVFHFSNRSLVIAHNQRVKKTTLEWKMKGKHINISRYFLSVAKLIKRSETVPLPDKWAKKDDWMKHQEDSEDEEEEEGTDGVQTIPQPMPSAGENNCYLVIDPNYNRVSYNKGGDRITDWKFNSEQKKLGPDEVDKRDSMHNYLRYLSRAVLLHDTILPPEEWELQEREWLIQEWERAVTQGTL